MRQAVEPDDAFKAYSIYRRCITGAGGKCKYQYGEHPHWTKMVEVARKHGVTAERLIRARFSAVSTMMRASMTPASIYSPAANVRMSLDCYDPDKFLDWPAIHTNMLSLLAGISRRMNQPPNMVLLDPMTSFYSWFRVAMMSPHDHRILERYLEPAVAEVMNDIELRQFIKEKLDGCHVRNFAGRI